MRADFTAGHPAIVQALCDRLVKQINQKDVAISSIVVDIPRINFSDVNDVIADPDFLDRDFLSIYIEKARALEVIIVLLLAKQIPSSENNDFSTRRNIKTLIDDQTGLAPSLKDVREALDNLVYLRHILKYSHPEGYTFAIEAFPRVLREMTPIEDYLDEKIEDYLEQQGEHE